MSEYRVTRAKPAVVAGGKHDEIAGMPVMHQANADRVDLATERMDGLDGHVIRARLGRQTWTETTGQEGQTDCSEQSEHAHAAERTPGEPRAASVIGARGFQ